MKLKLYPVLKTLLALVILFAVYILGFGAGVTRTSHGFVLPAISQPVAQDAVLVADAKQLGIDYSGVNIQFAPYLAADDIKDNTGTTGLFIPPNTIQVKTGITKQQEVQTVAYEFMHYFWQQLPLAQQKKMAIVYRDFYNTNQRFRTLTQPYTGPDSVIADERNSTACTLVQPHLLTAEFNRYCNQFVPNRSILF